MFNLTRYFSTLSFIFIALAARGDRRLAVLFIDLDRFREVNDTLGHAVGDELLIAVTHRFAGHLRSSDMLTRLGGDDVDTLVRNADTAMYQAKANGRGCSY